MPCVGSRVRRLAFATLAFRLAAGMPAHAAERPRFGGALVIVGRDTPAPSLDPLELDGALGGTLSRALYDTLYRFDADHRPRPHLVSDVSADADSRVWSLTLTPGLTFHDGRSLTATDVVYSLRRFFAAPAAEGGCALAEAAKTSAISERGRREIRIELGSGCATLPDVLADPRAAIVPAPPVTPGAPSAAAPQGGLGCGAFRLASASANEWVLEASETALAGRPFLDRVTLKRMPAASDVASGLEIGTLDAVVGATRMPESSGRFRGGGFDTVFLVLARNVVPFDSPETRRAIARAIDRTSIADVMLRGRAQVARSILPEARAAYRGLLAEPRPAQSSRLGVRDGRAPLALGVAREDADLVAVAERVQADLQEAGLVTRVVASDPSDAGLHLADGTLAGWITSRTFGDGAIADVLPRWLASAIPVVPSEALAAAADASRARSIESALRGLLGAERAVAADAAWIPLVHREIGVVSGERVGSRGEGTVTSDGGVWLEDLWQLPGRRAARGGADGEAR